MKTLDEPHVRKFHEWHNVRAKRFMRLMCVKIMSGSMCVPSSERQPVLQAHSST